MPSSTASMTVHSASILRLHRVFSISHTHRQTQVYACHARRKQARLSNVQRRSRATRKTWRQLVLTTSRNVSSLCPVVSLLVLRSYDRVAVRHPVKVISRKRRTLSAERRHRYHVRNHRLWCGFAFLTVLFSSNVHQPAMSAEQLRHGASWARPAFAEETSIEDLLPEDIVQHIVSDCSVCASISVCIDHHRRFKSHVRLVFHTSFKSVTHSSLSV